MNDQILDYYESEAERLAKDYIEQNEDILKRFISYIIDNDMIDEDDILEFCEEDLDAKDFHAFIEENYHSDMERIDGFAYEAWKERQNR